MDTKSKGQGAMGIVVLAVGIMIGMVVIGYLYNSVSGVSGLPASVTAAMAQTFTNSTTGMTLLGVAIIVGAAMFILSIMGGR